MQFLLLLSLIWTAPQTSLFHSDDTLLSHCHSLSLTLFALLFSLEEGCTCASVSMCVCVCGRGMELLYSLNCNWFTRMQKRRKFSIAAVVDVSVVSHSFLLWQIRLHSRFDLRHRHTHTHSWYCGRGGEKEEVGRTLICTRAEFSRCRWCCAYVCTRQRFSLVWSCDRKRQINEAGNQLGESNNKRASTVREHCACAVGERAVIQAYWECARRRQVCAVFKSESVLVVQQLREWERVHARCRCALMLVCSLREFVCSAAGVSACWCCCCCYCYWIRSGT